MEGTLLASNLGFPEGPVIMSNGSVVLCDGNTGELLRWKDGAMSTFATTGGSPWGAVLGTDGAIYVTQGGNVPGSPDQSAVAGIQRVSTDGSVELLSAAIGGYDLAGPNDLAFGPDGRLWFTDSGTEGDDRYAEQQPGRLYVLDASGGGELVIERPGVYPNGIAFDAQGRLYWTESMGHRVCRLENGEATTFAQLSDGHVPEGRILEEIVIGECATNCIFDGPTLWVTATKVAELGYQQTTGTFWSIATDATGGLPLIPGKL